MKDWPFEGVLSTTLLGRKQIIRSRKVPLVDKGPQPKRPPGGQCYGVIAPIDASLCLARLTHARIGPFRDLVLGRFS